MFRAFAAKTRLFHSAKWRDFIRNQPGIDADHAVFQLLGDAPDTGGIVAVKIGGEAVDGVIGLLNDLLLILKFHQRGHRAENLFLQQQ